MIRALDVTNVLSALEHSERQTRQEVPGREQSGRWSQREPCVLLQELAHLLQLRYTVRLEYLLLLHLLKISSIFRASVFRHQIDEGVEHPGPSLGLRLRVDSFWNIGARFQQLLRGGWSRRLDRI